MSVSGNEAQYAPRLKALLLRVENITKFNYYLFSTISGQSPFIAESRDIIEFHDIFDSKKEGFNERKCIKNISRRPGMAYLLAI